MARGSNHYDDNGETKQTSDSSSRTGADSGGGEDAPFSWDDHFHGSVTVGERGQVVIPASARKRFGIEPGDKLLMMSDPGKRSLMLCKMDTLQEFMTAFQRGLARIVEQDTDNTSAQTAAASPSHEDHAE